VSVLCGQAAVMIHNAQRVNRSIDESALLSNILDSITNAIITLDNEGRITRINRNAMAILELTPDVVGQRLLGRALPRRHQGRRRAAQGDRAPGLRDGEDGHREARPGPGAQHRDLDVDPPRRVVRAPRAPS
jgi:PAS domain-containing protein